jgi:hypothetical protein
MHITPISIGLLGEDGPRVLTIERILALSRMSRSSS